MNPGVIGGIIGSSIGIIGGIIGTYFSIKNTNSPKEKAFMRRCSIVVWVCMILFLLLLLYLPKPYNFLMWIPYAIFLPLGIIYINKKQQKIKEENKGVK